jgi:SAM-dependent methyltransferase
VSDVEAYSRLAGVYDELVVDPCFADWALFLDDVWADDEVGVESVLDVCCGTGLMAAELIPRGIRVVGIDASAAMLGRAAARLGSEVRLEQVVLPDLPIDEVFDAAISTFDGLNYLTLSDLRRTFSALFDRLRPAGWLVFDLHTEAMMDYVLAQPVIEGHENGRSFVIRNVIDVTTRAIDSTIELTGSTDQESFSECHRQYFHTDAQVRSALVEAGFVVAAVTDEYSRTPAHPSTMRATWVARRDPAGPEL